MEQLSEFYPELPYFRLMQTEVKPGLMITIRGSFSGREKR